jgi:hypothetical protein
MIAFLIKSKSDSITISSIPCLKEAEDEIIAKNNSGKLFNMNFKETYERVAEKGCKSILVFQKLGDAYFFEANYDKAVKWYDENFKMTIELDQAYYERYVYSLRSLGL